MRLFLLSLSMLVSVLVSTSAQAADPVTTNIIEAEIKAASQNMMTDPATVLKKTRVIEGLAAKLPGDESRTIYLARIRELTAQAYIRSDRASLAAPLVAQGLQLIAGIAKPLKVKGDLLMSRATLHRMRNEAVEALRDYQAAYQIFGSVNERRSQAMALQFMAALYASASDGDRAQGYYRQAAETFSGDPLLSLSLHNNRGSVLLSLERNREAVAEFNQALGVARELGKPELEAKVLINLARAQIVLNQFADAKRSLARAFTLTRGDQPTIMRRHLLATAAILADKTNDRARAVQLIGESFAAVDLKTTTPEFQKAHLYAYDIYAHVGDNQAALAHLEALKRLDDEAAKVATSTGAALMAAEFNYQEQELQIAQKEAKAQQFQKMLFGAVGIGSLLLTAVLAWGLVTTRRSRNKVAAANIELGESNVALEKALQAKTEFLATTSHEIRTPLNGILGMTQVMLADPRIDAQMRDRIGIVHGAGVTMRALVDDILDVAKMETGNLTVEAAPMDLCATLQEVTRIWAEQARGKGLRFTLDTDAAPRWIVSDSGRLRQIVFNLLSNAIKFTAAGEVTLRAAAAGERLQLVVADTGIGIPEGKFDEIFESFRQVDAGTTRQFGGTGLGLTICRNLAEALGGTIAVTSVEGRGSTFTVDLPLQLAEAPDGNDTGDADAGGAMLIVDRNPIARSMLRTLFETRVASLRFAASAEEALIMLGEKPATHLLADEGTLKAAGDVPVETLRTLIAAAPDAASAVLWTKPDEALQSQLSATGVGKIIEKPVAGTALVAAILPDAPPEKSAKGGPPLVSRAA